MPYRIDLNDGADDLLDRLIELGALDVERFEQGAIAAVIPDSVTPEQLVSMFPGSNIEVSPAAGRDAGSVWVLTPRPVHVGSVRIVPSDVAAQPGDLRLVDAKAFGTGLHPTTALCLELLDEALHVSIPSAVLDVGTGSGILALAALRMGAPRAVAIDIDDEALRVAAENARINGLTHRLRLARGGPEAVAGTWPLVLANVLAAPLIEMAPVLVRRVGHQGELVLSGIPSSLEQDVTHAYRRLGMHRLDARSRAGWAALVFRASW